MCICVFLYILQDITNLLPHQKNEQKKIEKFMSSLCARGFYNDWYERIYLSNKPVNEEKNRIICAFNLVSFLDELTFFARNNGPVISANGYS